MKIFDRLYWGLVHLIPPRGVVVEWFQCTKCGKIRLHGELHDGQRSSCPKCNGTKHSVPKRWKKGKLLWCMLFRRKDLLFGVGDGHDTYDGGVIQ